MARRRAEPVGTPRRRQRHALMNTSAERSRATPDRAAPSPRAQRRAQRREEAMLFDQRIARRFRRRGLDCGRRLFDASRPTALPLAVRARGAMNDLGALPRRARLDEK
jgi:hypothetical protein